MPEGVTAIPPGEGLGPGRAAIGIGVSPKLTGADQFRAELEKAIKGAFKDLGKLFPSQDLLAYFQATTTTMRQLWKRTITEMEREYAAAMKRMGHIGTETAFAQSIVANVEAERRLMRQIQERTRRALEVPDAELIAAQRVAAGLPSATPQARFAALTAGMPLISGQIVSAFDDAATAMRKINTAARELRQERGLREKEFEARSLFFALRDVHTALLSVGAGLTLTRAFQIGAQGELFVRRYHATFTALLGDEQKAVELMQRLEAAANRFGLDIYDVLQLGRALFPYLKGGTAELDQWVVRAARLQTVNPLKSVGDAARAFQEFLAGQTKSLEYLFNVRPSLIAEAKRQFADFERQVDFILESLGATEEAALKSADAFVTLWNELKLSISSMTSFGGIARIVRNVLGGIAQVLGFIRKEIPALYTIPTAFFAIVTAGTAVLSILDAVRNLVNRLGTTQAFLTIKEHLTTILNLLRSIATWAVSPGIRGMTPLGIGLAAAGGVWIGQQIGASIVRGRAIREGREEELERTPGYQDVGAVIMGGVVLIRRALEMAAADIEMQLRMAGVSVGNVITKAGIALARGLASVLELIGHVVGAARDMAADLRRRADEAEAEVRRREMPVGQTVVVAGAHGVPTTRQVTAAELEILEDYRRKIQAINMAAAEAGATFGLVDRALLNVATSGRSAAGVLEAVAADADKMQAIMRYYDQVDDITKRTAEQITSVMEDYSKDVTRMEANFAKETARLQEDFVRRQAQARADLEYQIARIRRDMLQREAEAEQEYKEQIEDINENHYKRIADIIRDYNRRREELERQHKLTILEAAANLDAQAIANENRRYQEQLASLEQQLQDQLAAQNEAYQESLRQAGEAHRKQLEQARKSDEQRIQDMREALARQQAIEREEHARQMDRRAQDFNEEMRERAAQAAERIKQIKKDGAEQLKELRDNFVLQLAAWSEFTYVLGDILRGRQTEALQRFAEFWNDLLAQFRDQAREGRIYDIRQYQMGGYVEKTGPALLHAGEYVLNANVVNALNRAPVPTRGGISVGGINIVINGVGSPESVAQAVRREILGIFRQLSANTVAV